MPLIIILVIICVYLLFRPNNAAVKAVEHGGPKDAAGCASLFLWIIGAGLLMTALVALLGGGMH